MRWLKYCLWILVMVWCVAGPLTIRTSEGQSNSAEQSIVELLTKFRAAAADADAGAYFECLDRDGVFFGTDPGERFTYESLQQFLQPYFSKGIGWEHDVKRREAYVGPHGQIGWFEEQSTRAGVGEMRTTGVVRKTADGWKIVQYNVGILIPNDAVEAVAALIQKQESPPAAADEDSTADAESPLSARQRQQIEESFEYVWKKIRDSYWDPNLGGVDWQATWDELRPELDKATTRTEALRVLNDLVNRMQVSHFSIIPESAYQELANSDQPGARGGACGLDVRIVGEQVIVVAVHPDSPASDQGVHAGWIVESIGDINVPEKLAEVKQELEGNPHQRVILASAANARLRGRVGDEIEVTFRDGSEQSQQRTLKLVPPRGKKSRFGHLPEFRFWVETDTLSNGIGYFRFNAFMNPVPLMKAYNQFIADHRDAPGIIIDVRGNGGGSGEIAMGMIGWLMPGEKASVGKVILRDNELEMIVRPRPNPFTRPVVVLIDEMSVSAAEFFASGIRDLTPARLIGTRTAGAVLGSQIERLPSGDGFQFAAANFISIRTGKTLEGIGVPPDQVVEPQREQLLAGKDSAIQSAIQWILAETD